MTKSWIVIIEDREEGLDGYGPFSSEEDAKRWATEQERDRGVTVVSCGRLKDPPR
jgi:hypothetical protein